VLNLRRLICIVAVVVYGQSVVGGGCGSVLWSISLGREDKKSNPPA